MWKTVIRASSFPAGAGPSSVPLLSCPAGGPLGRRGLTSSLASLHLHQAEGGRWNSRHFKRQGVDAGRAGRAAGSARAAPEQRPGRHAESGQEARTGETAKRSRRNKNDKMLLADFHYSAGKTKRTVRIAARNLSRTVVERAKKGSSASFLVCKLDKTKAKHKNNGTSNDGPLTVYLEQSCSAAIQRHKSFGVHAGIHKT